MLTRKNNVLKLCIPLLVMQILLLTGCWETVTTPANFLGGLFLSDSSKDTPDSLSVVDYSGQSGSALPSDSGAIAQVSGAVTGSIVLVTFTGFLSGNTIETPILNQKTGAIEGFTPEAGIVEIWNGGTQFTQFSTSYRPNRSYIPPASTPVDQFPKPAIAITLSAALPVGVVAVYLIAGKVARADGTLLPALKDKDGSTVTSPSGAPVAGTVWFQSK